MRLTIWPASQCLLSRPYPWWRPALSRLFPNVRLMAPPGRGAVARSRAVARSLAFYNTTIFWQWMRMPGDIVFAAGALLMAWDFMIKLLVQRKATDAVERSSTVTLARP